MALKYHPDHNPGDLEALKQFTLVKEAYEVLTTATLKKNYDLNYKPQPQPVAKAEAPVSDTGSSDKQLNRNLRYSLYITLEDVAKGCQRSIRYIRTNKGEAETVQLTVKVPAGAFHHQRLKLAGYGDTNGNTAGDLFVIIYLQSHPIFLKKGLDLRLNVPVSYIDIMLGSTIEVPTLTGIRKIKLKACQFEDINFTLKGHGLPDAKPHLRGDLNVYCFIEHPERLSAAEKNAMQNILRTWPHGEMMQQYQSYLNQLKRS